MGNLYLIDGSGISYRAFFALDQSLTNSKGLYTNAIFGVARIMIKIIKNNIKTNEDSVLFIHDKKTTTYRNELLESYKANRPKSPEEFIVQLPYIMQLVEKLGINVVTMDNYEADDVIATMAVKYKDKYDKVFIITSDKDMMQLVKGNIFILRPEKNVTDVAEYDGEAVFNKMGVHPDKIIDLLALMGDAADNVPGVKGIGEKTAQKLLAEYNSVEDIYDNIEKITGATKQKLIDGKDMAYLSKRLVQLQLDAPVAFENNELLYKGYHEELGAYLKELEFKSIIKELGLTDSMQGSLFTPVTTDDGEDFSKKGDYKLVKPEEADKLLKLLSKEEEIAFDIETTSLDPYAAEIVGMSFSFKMFEGYYLDLSKVEKEEKNKIISKVVDLLNTKFVIGQNLKYDYSILKSHGFDLRNIKFDTMLAAYLLNPDSRKFNLEELAEKYFEYKGIKYEEVLHQTLFSNTLMDVDVNKVAEYAGEDADLTFRLYKHLKPKLSTNDFNDLFEKIEVPLIPVLAEMELNGVYFDTEYLKTLDREYTNKIGTIATTIQEVAGSGFNPNSPKQVGELLFTKLGLKGTKKTKTGSYSTDAETLEELADQHPIIGKLLEHRKYQKLLTTYIQAIPQLVNRKTGRVHTSLNQTGTATGRLSSSDPNLQNLPIRDAEGEKIREAVKAQRDGYVLLSADYSQIELRVLAHVSKDPMLLDAYNNDKDIHTITAAKIFGISEEQVGSYERRVGKMVNFSIVYGVSAYGLAQRVGITNKEAGIFIERYFELYKGVLEYQKKTMEFYQKNGYVETIFGRKRFLRNLKLNKNEVERIAINMPIQGTAADIMKVAMINVYNTLPPYAKLILQVHDEIIIELPEEKTEEVKQIIKECMENSVKLDVPLKIDSEVATYWKK